MSVTSLQPQKLCPAVKCNLCFLAFYEQVCASTGTVMCPSVEEAIKHCIKSEIHGMWMVHKTKITKEGHVSLLPVIEAIRKSRYIYITKFMVWNIALEDDAIVSVADLLVQGDYPIQHLELIDCMLEMGHAFSKLARSFQSCVNLTTILLDYNMFGDAGCEELCEAMYTNVYILVLSLKYCGFTQKSGSYLATLIARTRLQELYLDGNQLMVGGAMELITPLVEQTYRDNYVRAELTRFQQQQELTLAASLKEGRMSMEDPHRAKKKGKRKKREPSAPIRVGPWIAKLSLKANGIDHNVPCGVHSIALDCIQLYARLLAGSESFRELDFRDNNIGEVGTKEFIAALDKRALARFPPARVQLTHRMSHDAVSHSYELRSRKLSKTTTCKNKNEMRSQRDMNNHAIVGGVTTRNKTHHH